MNKKQMIRNKISIFLMIASILAALLSIANGWNGCEVNALADTESSEYILPNSDTDYVTEDELNDLDDEELRYARNEIYARHGYIFEDKELNKYFMDKSWYEPTVLSNDFDESKSFNNTERANIKFINKFETGSCPYRTAEGYDNSEQQTTTEATTEATTSEEQKIEEIADQADQLTSSKYNDKKKEEIPEFVKYIIGLFVIILTVIQFYVFVDQNIIIGGIGGSIIACVILSFIEVGIVYLILKSILGAILSVFKVLFIIVVIAAVIGGIVIGINILKDKIKYHKEDETK